MLSDSERDEALLSANSKLIQAAQICFTTTHTHIYPPHTPHTHTAHTHHAHTTHMYTQHTHTHMHTLPLVFNAITSSPISFDFVILPLIFSFFPFLCSWFLFLAFLPLFLEVFFFGHSCPLTVFKPITAVCGWEGKRWRGEAGGKHWQCLYFPLSITVEWFQQLTAMDKMCVWGGGDVFINYLFMLFEFKNVYEKCIHFLSI